MKTLVTGSTGFIGQHLLTELAQRQLPYAALMRAHLRETSALSDWAGGCIIHLAGRAHVMEETTSDPLAAFRAANCDYAVQVAKQAALAGVKRLVYVSSIGVNGGQTVDSPYTESHAPTPHTLYAQSKYEAEMALTHLAAQASLELVIVRPPLIYGANAPGNFARLWQWTNSGWPLPLGAIHNRRSLLYVKNLVDFLILCTHHPKAANQTFLLSDGEDVSTTELLQALAKAKGTPSRLLPVPAAWLSAAMRLLGKGDMAQRLLSNLQIDSSKARHVLGWTPPFDFGAAVQDMLA